MIKLIASLFAFTTLFGGEYFFLLPDQNSAFLYRLNDALRNSSSKVLIITPSFSHSPLKKTLLKSAKKGSRITLITTKPNSSTLSMVQYGNIDLYRYSSRPLSGSLIIIDDLLLCSITAPLDQEQLTQAASFARCSDIPADIDAASRAVSALIKRSKPYLEQ